MDKFGAVITTTSIQRTMSNADLGDARLNERNGGLAEMVAINPGAAWPEAARHEAEAEAAYRFGRHAKTDHRSVLEPAFSKTSDRIAPREDDPTLAVHDTTCFDFGKSFRPGLGSVKGSNKFGFYGHLTLAVRAVGPKLPDGLLESQLWRRSIPDRVAEDERDPTKDCLPTMDNEADKWMRGVEAAEQQCSDASLVHIMDRGADSYRNLASLVGNGHRFVLRANQNHRVYNDALVEGMDSPKIEDALAEAETVAYRTIELSSRDRSGLPAKQKKHPPREKRQARVAIRKTTVELRGSVSGSEELPGQIKLGLVWVREVDPPEGADPVDWRLFTGEPLETSAEVEKVVDWYVRRWVIEEYFEVLKGACRIEERQLASAKTLTVGLAHMAVAAWRLLALRTLAQSAPEAPALEAFRKSQLEVLAADSKTRLESSADVSAGRALKAVAAMGGHLSHNGPPGWKVIHRGFQRLQSKEFGWRDGQRDTLEQVQQLCESAEDLEALQRRLDQLTDTDTSDDL